MSKKWEKVDISVGSGGVKKRQRVGERTKHRKNCVVAEVEGKRRGGLQLADESGSGGMWPMTFLEGGTSTLGARGRF